MIEGQIIDKIRIFLKKSFFPMILLLIIASLILADFSLAKLKKIARDLIDKISWIATTSDNPFGPAAIVQPLPSESAGQLPPETFPESDLGRTGNESAEVKPPPPLTFGKPQKVLDDVAKRIEVLNQKMIELAKEKGSQLLKEEKENKETEELKEIVKKENCSLNSININTALANELEKITGIGPDLAQRIIEARPFSSLSDLIRVKGIGEITLQKIIAQGCAYVEPLYFAGVPSPSEPAIQLFYSQENPVNKEIEVSLFVSNLKRATYDLKISIENGTTTLSETYHSRENEWKSSRYYLLEVFSGTSFDGQFKLRIKQENFRGKANIVARLRESGKTTPLLEFKDKILIINPENQLPIAKFIYTPKNPTFSQEILFDASSSRDDGSIKNFIWDFGDGNSKATNSPTTTHSYSISGSFPITLLVIDNLGATSSTSTIILISEKPEKKFAQSLIITEVQIADNESSFHDFIEIYNPTDSEIFFQDYNGGYLKLVKTSKTGNKNVNIKSWRNEPEAKIPSKRYFLWVSSKDKNYSLLALADASTTETISSDNGVALVLIKDEEELILDAIGWGNFNNVLFETAPYPENPELGKTLARKISDDSLTYQDNNNNSLDFEIQNPTPRNHNN